MVMFLHTHTHTHTHTHQVNGGSLCWQGLLEWLSSLPIKAVNPQTPPGLSIWRLLSFAVENVLHLCSPEEANCGIANWINKLSVNMKLLNCLLLALNCRSVWRFLLVKKFFSPLSPSACSWGNCFQLFGSDKLNLF